MNLPATKTRKGRSEEGFSLIEVLIAAALMLFVMLGLLPLFVRSMVHNSSGRESSLVTNTGKSTIEDLLSVDFDNARIVNDTGAAFKTTGQHFDHTTNTWVAGTPGGTMRRNITIRQFSGSDLYDDGQLNTPFGTPGAGFAPVHLREIEVEILGVDTTSQATGLALNKDIVVRTLRAF